MQLDHEFTVPIPAEQAWEVLLDIAKIAPCLPGAAIDSVTDDRFTGRVKVLVGPISVSYTGEGRFVERDKAARRVRIEAGGKQTRGSGTAKATISAQLHDQGSSTRVTVQTELSITGKPAQFGRGVMADVGSKLLGQFADCLAKRLAGSPEPPQAAPPNPPDEALNPAPGAEPVPIDLLGTAGGPVLRRLAPVAALAAAVAAVLLGLRRRRRRRRN